MKLYFNIIPYYPIKTIVNRGSVRDYCRGFYKFANITRKINNGIDRYFKRIKFSAFQILFDVIHVRVTYLGLISF